MTATQNAIQNRINELMAMAKECRQSGAYSSAAMAYERVYNIMHANKMEKFSSDVMHGFTHSYSILDIVRLIREYNAA